MKDDVARLVDAVELATVISATRAVLLKSAHDWDFDFELAKELVARGIRISGKEDKIGGHE